jgi:hypothetical protein
MRPSFHVLALPTLFVTGLSWAQQSTPPSISRLNPSSIAAGSQSFNLVVLGSNFDTGSAVFWNGNALVTTVLGTNQLQALVPAQLVANPGTANIYVQNLNTLQSGIAVFTINRAIRITDNSVLPTGTTGVPYSYTFIVASGVAPYRWAIAGNVPPGLTLHNTTGTLSGVPTVTGAYTFTVQVIDNEGAQATKTFTLAVQTAPLEITTVSLFNGIVGNAYTQVFNATGGRPPYQWSLTGDSGGLSFDASTGTLTGTPRSIGSFPLTIRVTDSIGASTSKSFTLVVEAPRLNILTASPLPAGTAGTSYSQTFTALGGTPPLAWSVSSGSTGDLQIEAATGILSGIPAVPGTLNFTIQVRDSGGQTSTRSFALTIQPRALAFLTATQLPDGTVASPLSIEIAATGGVLPYTWSATGLPEGLEINPSTGVISGTPKAPGTFLIAIRVTDQTRASAVELFRLPIHLPALPEFTLTGLSGTVNPAEQLPLRLSMNSPIPVPVTGQLVLTFLPDTGLGDSTVQFSTGGRTVDFQIPADSTTIALADIALQTGTVAGTIRVSLRLQSGSTDITPTPAPAFAARVERAAPLIRTASMARSGSTVTIEIRGFSTPREVTQAVFRFRANAGNSLRANEITVSVEDLFNSYFQNAASAQFGSQFVFTQPFTVDGDPAAVVAESVTLTNRSGSTTFNVQN